MRRSEWVAEFRHDVRYALRQLRASPRFTIVSVLTLAVGLGAVTTIFGIANTVLLRALPFADPDRLVISVGRRRRWGRPFPSPSRTTSTGARASGGSPRSARSADASLNIRGDAGPERRGRAWRRRTRSSRCSASRPRSGVPFAAEEDSARGRYPGCRHRPRTVAAALRRRCARDLPQSVELDGVLHRVIGVMPRGFDFPERVEVWVPLAPSERYHRGDRRLEDGGATRPWSTRASRPPRSLPGSRAAAGDRIPGRQWRMGDSTPAVVGGGHHAAAARAPRRAAGDRGTPVAHGVRERRQSAARAGGNARARDGRARGVRRRPRAHCQAAPRRRAGALDPGRRGGGGRGRRRHSGRSWYRKHRNPPARSSSRR